MKRVFIIHGWAEGPESGWFPWIKATLQRRGFEVHVLEMPGVDKPVIRSWVAHIRKSIKRVDENTYIICHGAGCKPALVYLASLKNKKRLGGFVSVAGWFRIIFRESESKKDIDRAYKWISTPISFEKAKKRSKAFIAIFSTGDPYTPQEDIKAYKRELGAKIILVQRKWHLGGKHNVNRLPVALKALLEMAR